MTQIIDQVKSNRILIVCIAIVVALLVVNIVFIMGWQSVKGEQSTLKEDEANAQNSLNVARDQYDTVKLQQDLAALSGTPNFPLSVSNVELSSFLAATAKTADVSIVSVTPITSSETIGNKKYPKQGFQVEITASTSAKINSFLQSLEAGRFVTLRLENLSFGSKSNVFDMVVVTQP